MTDSTKKVTHATMNDRRRRLTEAADKYVEASEALRRAVIQMNVATEELVAAQDPLRTDRNEAELPWPHLGSGDVLIPAKFEGRDYVLSEGLNNYYPQMENNMLQMPVIGDKLFATHEVVEVAATRTEERSP